MTTSSKTSKSRIVKHKHDLEVVIHKYTYGDQVTDTFVWYCRECPFVETKTIRYLES